MGGGEGVGRQRQRENAACNPVIYRNCGVRKVDIVLLVPVHNVRRLAAKVRSTHVKADTET